MKLNLSFFLFLVFMTSKAQIINIPDNNFKNALINDLVADINGNNIFDSNVDTNNDGEIQISEAESVLKLNIANKNISSLNGIEYFTNLTELRCEENNLTELVLSHNLELYNLFCNDNQLSNLNVINCINLNRIHCNYNNLTELDFSLNSNLYAINCDDNQLTSLNVKNGNNTNLFQMWCDYNTNLLCIQVDNVTYSNNATNWVKEDSAMYSEMCENLSIEDVLNSKSIKLFPNPVKNTLSIETTEDITNIKIYSINGKLLIQEKNNLNIDLSKLDKGLYFIQFYINEEIVSKEIIKN